MREGAKRALLDNAAPQMEEGDEATVVMLGQTFVTPLVYLLVFPLAFIFMVKSRAVAASERNIYVIDQSIWKQKEAKAVRRYPLASTKVEKTAFGIKVGDEEKVYALLGQFGPMKEIAAKASASQASG